MDGYWRERMSVPDFLVEARDFCDDDIDGPAKGLLVDNVVHFRNIIEMVYSIRLRAARYIS